MIMVVVGVTSVAGKAICNQYILLTHRVEFNQLDQSQASHISYFIFQLFFFFRKTCVFFFYCRPFQLKPSSHIFFLSISLVFVYIYKTVTIHYDYVCFVQNQFINLLQFNPRDIIYTSIMNHQYMTINIIQYCHVGVTSITKKKLMSFFTQRKNNNVNYSIYITCRY